MSASFVIFVIQICLVHYAISQRVNGPSMASNAPQYGPNVGHGGTKQGPVPLNGVLHGPGVALTGPISQAFAGMPNHAFAGAGMLNQAFAGSGMQNQMMKAAGKTSQLYGGAGNLNLGYGGSGNGEVTVDGELPVTGMTSVTGHVPMTGKVTFNGNVPCGGVVTISGGCTSCGLNAPWSQIQSPVYGNKPYGH